MTGRTPPFRFIATGRVYRHDLSPRHSPMFHQIEGFLGGRAGELRRPEGRAARLRAGTCSGPTPGCASAPTTSPFTEPSAELDYSCSQCGGSGCKVCSDSGWVEWGGCGMIHPAVLERCQIDAERYQGFAFGMGIDRTAMGRFDIPHLRHLFEGDLRVLGQL